MKVFLVIAAHNESRMISQVVSEAKGKVDTVIVVDDGSADNTGRRAASAGAEVITHEVNRGQGAALQTGIDFALTKGADIMVTYDADGQFVPEEIELVTAPLLNRKVHVVLGSRFLSGPQPADNIPVNKRIVLTIATWLTKLYTGLAVTDTHNGFRAFDRQAAMLIDIKQDGMAHASEIIEQIKQHDLSFKEVPVTVNYSEYSLEKGQKISNSLRIVWNLFFSRISK
jgi:glycosyltransferase involved in cell wall biosynthesis